MTAYIKRRVMQRFLHVTFCMDRQTVVGKHYLTKCMLSRVIRVFLQSNDLSEWGKNVRARRNRIMNDLLSN